MMTLALRVAEFAFERPETTLDDLVEQIWCTFAGLTDEEMRRGLMIAWELQCADDAMAEAIASGNAQEGIPETVRRILRLY